MTADRRSADRRSVTAIVAARGGSVRLPGKALLPFPRGGRETLIAHKVRQLLACRFVSRVVINSDAAAIVESGVAAGGEAIEGGGRDYAGDTHAMLEDSARRAGGDIILWAHPTNPLVKSETYDRAIEAFLAALDDCWCDSLLSVYEMRRHAWYRGGPLNYDPQRRPHPLAAQTEPVFFQDGAIFIQPREQMIANGYFFDRNPLLFTTPADEVGDIDTARDYELCTLSS